MRGMPKRDLRARAALTPGTINGRLWVETCDGEAITA
jgi:hypothetical protein